MRCALILVALAASLAASPVAAGDRADTGAERTVIVTAPAAADGVAAYGPFRVLDASRAALVDATDSASVRAFQAMLRDHPGIAVIEMVECPGTDDDSANLRLGRMIRARGIATHVPSGGSVRSGAVELFLAGSSRLIDDGAEFAVHAWRDSDGREPGDYAADSPYNRAYVEYYREMGVADPQAFYDMTNAVPNSDARWLTAQDMRGWLGDPRDGDVTVTVREAGTTEAPSIAYLDLGVGFP
ncbi:alpha/beta hydrolase [Tsuneonella sp. YG55]|uniref:Alpha/beta hydrolase n=1 Tax=Tsuneonella litorea TaxID=2976475 RepID=A0A9X2VY33_9SPHN|nr:alpha/beta hydrolase [Tsuneonella litorea]MCT2557442.1 alpha/beta hydrolase [Tsuneonella litorea]